MAWDYKPGGFCSSKDCPCQFGDGWVCKEFKDMDPNDEYCAECGYSDADHEDRPLYSDVLRS
jgi:hypothetical protein